MHPAIARPSSKILSPDPEADNADKGDAEGEATDEHYGADVAGADGPVVDEVGHTELGK